MNSNRIRTDILHAVMLREQIAGVRKRDAVRPKCPVCGGVRRQEALGRACEWCGSLCEEQAAGPPERENDERQNGRARGTRAGCESKKLHSPCKNAVQGCANDQHAKKCGPPARPAPGKGQSKEEGP